MVSYDKLALLSSIKLHWEDFKDLHIFSASLLKSLFPCHAVGG